MAKLDRIAVAEATPLPGKASCFEDQYLSSGGQIYELMAGHDRFVAEGVPLVDDREQAWRDFAGWRVNYDRPLLSLATFVESPPTPWSSDRQVDLPPPINLRRGRRWS